MIMVRRIVFALLLASSLVSRELPLTGDEDAPERSEWDRFNERCASDSLRTLTTAEEDFRANERDGEHVQDFFTPTPAATGEPADSKDGNR